MKAQRSRRELAGDRSTLDSYSDLPFSTYPRSDGTVLDAPGTDPESGFTLRSLSAKVGNYRWTICGLLFFATTLNYMDRQVLALLLPTLQDSVKGIGLTQVQYGMIVSVFSFAYAVGLLLAGNTIDRVGTKKGYAGAVILWSFAAMSHFFVTVPRITKKLGSAAHLLAGALEHLPLIGKSSTIASIGTLSGVVIGFGFARFLLGLGEAGNFPAAIKATAEWFPKKERALATGIFNSGTNIGATIAPFLVGFVVLRFGWHYAFLTTGFFALIWLVLCLTVYRPPQQDSHVSIAELAYINSDPPESAEKIPWTRLFPHRQTWAFLCGKLMTDPIWWFYLYWLPGFLHAKYGLSIARMGLPLLIIYNVCTIGSVFGGWLPSKFIGMGWSLNRARKTAMLIYACGIVPIMFIGHAPNIWVAIGLISMATSCHQTWSCNLFTLASDMFPRRAVASIVGIGGFGGACAMMFFGTFVGFILKVTDSNYVPAFILAGSAYLLAILAIQLLAPRLTPANLD
jgi:MFS transporter, ACS family, hexuronate transporter